MVGPPPTSSPSPTHREAHELAAQEKQKLRNRLKAARRDHVRSLPANIKALMFYRPPAPLVEVARPFRTIGLYHATGSEAPTLSYAKWFHENGHALALPRFESRDGAMTFRTWTNPYDDEELETGPFGLLQPRSDSEDITPGLVIVPLVGFTSEGGRLGQGGGHYDRWLEQHPDTIAIGLGWDCQRVESLPAEDHDRHMHMVVTPTRLYEGCE